MSAGPRPLVTADPATEIAELLRDSDLCDALAATAHLSMLGPASGISVRDPNGRATSVIGFLPLPMRGADLLADIAEVDENAPRLEANFGRAFPATVENLTGFGADLADLETPALGWLLLAASLLLDLSDDDVAAALCGGDAVRLDTVVIERGGRYCLDGRALLRSLMSYRLAEVPGPLLIRSVFESLGDFVADGLRRLLRDVDAQVVVCAGDLFAGNRILRERTRLALLGLRVPVVFAGEPA